jgi:hypothetical protein
MNAFTYARASSAAGALLLARDAQSKYLGGGANLVDLMRETSRNASLCKKHDPSRRETHASTLWRAQKESLTVEADAPRPWR